MPSMPFLRQISVSPKELSVFVVTSWSPDTLKCQQVVPTIPAPLPQPVIGCVCEVRMKDVSWEKPGKEEQDKDTNRV